MSAEGYNSPQHCDRHQISGKASVEDQGVCVEPINHEQAENAQRQGSDRQVAEKVSLRSYSDPQ